MRKFYLYILNVMLRHFGISYYLWHISLIKIYLLFLMHFSHKFKQCQHQLDLLTNICRRVVSGIPSDSNCVDRGATLVARKSYYDEEYSVYLCGRASLLSLYYSVQQMFGAIVEFGGDGVGIRPDDGS